MLGLGEFGPFSALGVRFGLSARSRHLSVGLIVVLVGGSSGGDSGFVDRLVRLLDDDVLAEGHHSSRVGR